MVTVPLMMVRSFFGDQTDHAHGFLALAVHDDNGDGVIDAKDSVFEDLIIWTDLNGDGVSQSGEMFSLTDFDITSITLGATSVNYQIAGNDIRWESTFSFGDGTTGTVVDAFFDTSAID